MAGALTLRRKKDGSLHLVGDPPSDHYFSGEFVRNGMTSGEVSVAGGTTTTVTLHVAGGDVVYRLLGFEQEDGTPNKESWHVELAGGA